MSDVRRPVRRVIRFALTLAILLAVLKPLIAFLEPKLVFFPYRGQDATPSDFGADYQAIALTTADGEQLTAWQLEPATPVADVVYFHGNGGNLSVWLPALLAAHRMGLRVLAVDYRGYGLSTGAPTEDGVYRDAEAAVRLMREQRAAAAARPLIYWGRSLGGPVAASAARSLPPDGLILESTFPDKASVIRRQPVLRLLNVFSTFRFSTIEHLRDFKAPILVMHGDRDSVIPFALGQELFERLDGRKHFVVIPGADHNDAFDAADAEYWSAVMSFIETVRR